MSGTAGDVSHRERAMLAAVAAQRAQMSCSCEPDLFIDGMACCDQAAAHALARRGLIRPACVGAAGGRVAAELTDAGAAVLGWTRLAA